MKATIVGKDDSLLMLRPENDPANLVLVWRTGPSDPNFTYNVGDVVEMPRVSE